MLECAHELKQVMKAIHRSISLEDVQLPDEFFPAHLSAALIDSIWRSQGQHDATAGSAAERYCDRFEVPRTRADRWTLPPVEEQEPLADLTRRYDELGVDRMADEVFRNGTPLTELTVANAERVLRTARGLRRIGIDVLQDVLARPLDDVEHELRLSTGLCEPAFRMLQMYTGSDDFVRGDGYVRDFVADALGDRWVSRARAEHLVRCSAYELIVSPRFLDDRIWRSRLMR